MRRQKRSPGRSPWREGTWISVTTMTELSQTQLISFSCQHHCSFGKFPPYSSSVNNFALLCCFQALLLSRFQAQDCAAGLFVLLLPDPSLKQPQISVETQALPLFFTQALNRAWSGAEALMFLSEPSDLSTPGCSLDNVREKIVL